MCMKRIVLSVWMAVAVCLAAAAQQAAEMLAFTGEVTVGKLEKEDMFKRMLAWHQDNLPKEALRETNESTGELKGTSFLRYTSHVNAASDLTQGYILYDFKITATENGFHYVMTNFRHEARIKFHTLTNYPCFPYKINTVEKPWYDLVWKDLKAQINQHIPKMIATMKEVAEKESYVAQLRDKAKDTLVSQLLTTSLE